MKRNNKNTTQLVNNELVEVDQQLAEAQSWGEQPQLPTLLWNLMPRGMRKKMAIGASVEVANAVHQGVSNSLQAGTALQENQLESSIKIGKLRTDLRTLPALLRGESALLDVFINSFEEQAEKYEDRQNFLLLQTILHSHILSNYFRENDIDLSPNEAKEILFGMTNHHLNKATSRLSEQRSFSLDDEEEIDVVVR